MHLPIFNILKCIRSFTDVHQTHALHQQVSCPTCVHGHWLKLFITRSTCNDVKPISHSERLLYQYSVIIDLWL